MSQIKLNVEEMGDFVKHMITNNQYIQEKGMTPVTVNISGDAGLGKTSAIMQLGKELGLQVEKLNLAQLEELGDLIGFPVKEFKVKNSEGKVLWVTEQEIAAANEKGYKVIDTTEVGSKVKPFVEKISKRITQLVKEVVVLFP